MAHYITATHKVSKRSTVFIKVVNPKNAEDFYYKDTAAVFNGRAYSLERIKVTFNVNGGYSA